MDAPLQLYYLDVFAKHCLNDVKDWKWQKPHTPDSNPYWLYFDWPSARKTWREPCFWKLPSLCLSVNAHFELWTNLDREMSIGRMSHGPYDIFLWPMPFTDILLHCRQAPARQEIWTNVVDQPGGWQISPLRIWVRGYCHFQSLTSFRQCFAKTKKL